MCGRLGRGDGHAEDRPECGADGPGMPDDALPARRNGAGKARGPAGAIILTRHGEPDLSRKVRLNAAGYSEWWATYEEKGLKPGQTAPAHLHAAAKDAVIISSTRPRSVES